MRRGRDDHNCVIYDHSCLIFVAVVLPMISGGM
jgi:hypothetical protein